VKIRLREIRKKGYVFGVVREARGVRRVRNGDKREKNRVVGSRISRAASL